MKRYYRKVLGEYGTCLIKNKEFEICDLYWIRKKNFPNMGCVECEPESCYKEITEQEYKIRKRRIKK